MKKTTKTIISIGAFILFLGISVFAYQSLSKNYKPDSSLTKEDSSSKDVVMAPDFTAVDMDGNTVKLSDYFGKPIVLNFWASWCPPCKGEMPHFEKVFNEMKNEVTFLMVDLVDGQQETVQKGKEFIESKQYHFPVLFDTEQSAANTYGIRSIPSTFFINKDGSIETAAQGAIDENSLRRGIVKITEGGN